jgi:hypothetical protein
MVEQRYAPLRNVDIKALRTRVIMKLDPDATATEAASG